MQKTITLILFVLISLTNNVFSQNGTFNCSNQAYSKMDNYETKSYNDKMIITIEINSAIGGYVSINNLSKDFNFRYDILSKDDVTTDKDKRTITTTYIVKMSQLNVQIGDEVLLGIVENMDNNNLNFWIYNKKYNGTNYYFDLSKYKIN